MGMYTEFHFNVELKENVPQQVIDILNYMLSSTKGLQPDLPNHPLFALVDGRTVGGKEGTQEDETRWRWMLLCDSYYFSADTHSTLRFDDISECYYLCIRCNLKNYNKDIEKFLSWILPYVSAAEGEFLGFKRYEEEKCNPTLIHMPKEHSKDEED